MTETEPNLADILAIDRTWMAAQRSLMAWVRTALSMITVGGGCGRKGFLSRRDI